MVRRVKIAPHLSAEELERRYRQASSGIERSHHQIIWLLTMDYTTAEVAALTSYSRNWIYELVRGYNRLGPESLGDKRQVNPGKPPLLNEIQQAQLWQRCSFGEHSPNRERTREALQEQPPDGDLWDGPKVAQWMSDLLGRPIHPQRGWEYLKTLGMSRRRPRPAHIESDPEVQQEWEKTPLGD